MHSAGQPPLNQPTPRGDIDLWAEDGALRTYAGETSALAEFGRAFGRAEAREQAVAAQINPPRLSTHDRTGARIDRVTFHPAYHQLMELGLSHGYAAMPWEAGGTHLAHAAMVYLAAQVEPGICCPMTMTYAAVPALAADKTLSDEWTPYLTTRGHDGSDAPLTRKSAATLGMAMTEKQGGSDVRANSTRAEREGEDYRLFGHKWFFSAPMSDGFLTLANAPDGLTCFLVPRWCPDGSLNQIHLQRLKDKLGNRANASAEAEYHGAHARRLGGEGDGIRTIIKMVHHTRLDTALMPAGLMRAALSEAYWWCEHRTAFQRRLIDQPLMRSVLADLALDWEGALALGLHVAEAFDDPDRAAFARIAVALAKYLSNKRCPVVTYEAMEILGGMGYVEETPMPMLYREAPLNSIWEGSGNVICLDVLRALSRDPETRAALDTDLDAGCGGHAGYDAALSAHRERWPALPSEEEARWFTESLAVLLTASVLLRKAPGPVADGWIGTRVQGHRGATTGAVSGLDIPALLSRLAPH